MITGYGLTGFVTAAICWWLFVREVGLPEHQFQEMPEHEQRIYWIVGFLFSIVLGALWPILCAALVWLRLRRWG